MFGLMIILHNIRKSSIYEALKIKAKLGLMSPEALIYMKVFKLEIKMKPSKV